jgi:pimeloyl-ACP methyl ester carboxylesterase
MNRKQVEVYGVPGLVGFTALLGFIVHMALIDNPTAGLTNQYFGVWYTAMLMISALQLWWVQVKPEAFVAMNRAYYAEMFYLVSVTLCSFMSFICWAIAANTAPDTGARAGSAWALIICLTTAFTIYLTSKRRKEPADPKLKDEDNVLVKRLARYLNSLIRGFHFCVVVLLTAGAITNASIPVYAPPGTVFAVQMTDGRQTNVHVYCLGPKNATTPVIWFTSSPAHGVVDFYGVQYFLSQKGRRVCTFDPLGFGWSADLVPNAVDQMTYLDGTLTASGEQGPFILAGWGAGGELIADYVQKFPAKVKSVVFLTYYPPGIEFLAHAAKKGLTVDQMKAYRKSQWALRSSSGGIILGLAIPWGLMPVFVPTATVDAQYYPAEKALQFRTMSWKSRMWVGQFAAIKYFYDTSDSQPNNITDLKPFPPNIPLSHVFCRLNDTQICKYGKVPEPFCGDAAYQNSFTIPLQIAMTKIYNPNATIVFDQADDCDLGMPVAKPKFTADTVFNFVKDITLP